MSEMQPFAPPGPDSSASKRIPPPPPPTSWTHDAQPTVGSTWTAVQPTGTVHPVVTDQRSADGVVLALAWIAAVLTLGYMLPWAIAVTRGRSNHGAIGLINLFLGWSVIGWIVAMVMACQAHQVVGPGGQATVVVAQHFSSHPVGAPSSGLAPAGWYPSPDGRGRRYWSGVAWTDHYSP